MAIINRKKLKSADDLVYVLEKKKGGVMLEGIYEDIPGEYCYAFDLNSLASFPHYF